MATFYSDGVTNKPYSQVYTNGAETRDVAYKYTITTGNHANGDQFVLASGLSFNDTVIGIFGSLPALTGATDSDLGFFYKDGTGALVALDADILWDGVSLASAAAYLEQLGAKNASLVTTKTVGEHLGLKSDDFPIGGVYLVLTLNNKSTAASAVVDVITKIAN